MPRARLPLPETASIMRLAAKPEIDIAVNLMIDGAGARAGWGRPGWRDTRRRGGWGVEYA
ncbi:hypothetical protein CSH63_33695 [Micromonospora tulbaghiae]|uniref:Uncharacterized protein n=1 Tax=Micromonospora tulbaghiae TaxID=479978 RepID=A0A386WUZ2_9ACTN|nr:hypothetical protein CSH63_33695 [Micromonospora tulbaghiae]